MKEKKSKEAKKATATAPAAVEAQTMKPRTFQEVGLSQIKVNPLNPRKNFSGPKYDELLSSVRTKGVIVPVLLRPHPDKKAGTEYEIIAGERRFRASCEVSKANGGIEKAKIPAIVQEMSDDHAYDCMTIENLQRADLTPLEEARAFKLYLDRKGPDSLQDLADRVGINPCYIRRRTVVLSLPETILKSWEVGNLAFGHLEQLVRAADPEKQKELYEAVLRYGMTVKLMKEQIESQTPKLSCALFNKPLAGCPECSHNTDVQRSLFGEDIAGKSLCLDPKCFKKYQGEWILANWDKFKSSRNLKTNGFAFEGEFSWEQRHSIYSNTLKGQCKTCEHFKSIITLAGGCGDNTTCLGPKKCHDALYNSSSAAARKEKDPNAPRVSWHGEHFREEFFKTRIPELIGGLSPDDEKVLRILLLTLLEANDGAGEAFGQKYDKEHMVKNSWSDGFSYSVHSNAWTAIEKLDPPTLKKILQELSLLILMQTSTTTAAMRHMVGVHLGSDLSTEWRLTEDYLNKKTTKEIHAIAEQFGFFKDDKARTYLHEKLLKKRDRFDLCKKGELVKIILESGIDLSGKVPDEILK